MRRYETTFVLRPGLGEAQFTEVIDRTVANITDGGGSIISLQRWGMRRLAYDIGKERQGYYVYIDHAAVPAVVAEMERIFKIDDRILRYLTIKVADRITTAQAEEEVVRVAESRLQAERKAAEDAANPRDRDDD
ncbi:MAG: 30S ribosomal protein S6 [Desulfobulbaceae bacterium A2]|nr:MAG: 30S ribosomal protein S6 [Desulfobulbaceae bacterium A2]